MMFPRGRVRGSSVGVVLTTLTLTIFLMFVSLSSGLQQLSLASQLDGRARARDAAESLLSKAIAELCRNPKWGQDGTTTLHLEAQYCPPEGGATLSFNGGAASAAHVKRSTNNLLNTASVAGFDRTVPRDSCHLIAIGWCGGQRLQVETVFVMPPYPTGCASTGPIEMSSVRIWGQPPEVVPTQPLNPSPSEEAHVFSNYSKGEEPGVRLGPGCEIQGNAGAVGLVQVDSAAVVRGEVRHYAQPGVVPHFDIQALWAQVDDYVGEIPYEPGKPVEMFCVVANDLTISGDLELRGGTLAVKGNLRIMGKLKGQGLVLATGDVEAHAGSDFNALRKTALLSGGKVTLDADDRSYVFNGLVYAKGDVTAHDLTVLGAVICDGPLGTERVKLERVNLVQSAVALESRITDPKISPKLPAGYKGNSLVAHLHAFPDPANPSRRLAMGAAVYTDDEMKAPPGRNSSTDEIHGVVWAPPKVYFKIGTGFTNQGLLKWDEGRTRVEDFNGDLEVLKRQFIGLANSHGHYDDDTDGVRSFVHQQLDALKPEVTSGVLMVEVSNLVPAVDRVKLLTWTESAPLP